MSDSIRGVYNFISLPRQSHCVIHIDLLFQSYSMPINSQMCLSYSLHPPSPDINTVLTNHPLSLDIPSFRRFSSYFRGLRYPTYLFDVPVGLRCSLCVLLRGGNIKMPCAPQSPWPSATKLISGLVGHIVWRTYADNFMVLLHHSGRDVQEPSTPRKVLVHRRAHGTTSRHDL